MSHVAPLVRATMANAAQRTLADGLHLSQGSWVTPEACLRHDGWFYLSTILDDYSRYIIAWKLCTTMKAEDVTDTLDLALDVSGSLLNALKRLSQTPACVQRRNRQWAVRQLPSSGGKSRQGDAVRASQRTASTNSRLSAAVRPRSPFLPGTSGSIHAHCASVRVRLLKIASVFDLESNLNQFGNPQMKTPPTPRRVPAATPCRGGPRWRC